IGYGDRGFPWGNVDTDSRGRTAFQLQQFRFAAAGRSAGAYLLDHSAKFKIVDDRRNRRTLQGGFPGDLRTRNWSTYTNIVQDEPLHLVFVVTINASPPDH